MTKPRGDIAEVVDGRPLKPFQGLTSWAAFQQSGKSTMVMGDIVLLEHEVNPALSAALDGGLEVTALHNHFFYDQPRVYFMHIGGSGDEEKLANGVRAVLDAAAAAEGRRLSRVRHCPPRTPSTRRRSSRSLQPTPRPKDGMAKFVFGKTTRCTGRTSALRWASTRGPSSPAQPCGSRRRRLRDARIAASGSPQGAPRGSINIVAIHSHMAHEEPRILFLHYWGKGPAEGLAGQSRER